MTVSVSVTSHVEVQGLTVDADRMAAWYDPPDVTVTSPSQR